MCTTKIRKEGNIPEKEEFSYWCQSSKAERHNPHNQLVYFKAALWYKYLYLLIVYL